MPTKVAVTTLNASTVDILNAIRNNASYEYQNLVPEVTDERMIPRVGEVLLGYPALANQFINSLVNRIALVRVKSATFNNHFRDLKKGYLELGETVEEVFVNVAKAREFSVEKAEKRELKRTLPDVRTAFHARNWYAQYPITIQNDELKTAFTSINGVQDLITKIINSVYTAAEYDEYLLFKYLMIKAITSGKMFAVSIGNGDIKQAAIQFRGMSNKLTFMSNKYNASGVTTVTDKSAQQIFMDATYNAEYDVSVLAAAFNMDKAEYTGKLRLIDDWTTFDHDRFSEILENSDMIDPITEQELALMGNVKAVLVDEEWFQVYNNLMNFSEKYVASGIYWNYFLNVFMTISYSPFSNAVVFVTDGANVAAPASINFEVVSKSISENATVLTLGLAEEAVTASNMNYQFVQTQDATEKGIAIHKYGAIIFTPTETSTTPEIVIGETTYRSAVAVTSAFDVGDTFAMNKVE